MKDLRRQVMNNKKDPGVKTTEDGEKRVFLCLDRIASIDIINRLLPEKDDCFLSDLVEDIQRKAATTVGAGRDIVVTVRPGLDAYGIEFIQEIEKRIDKALTPIGFTRSKSGKWGHKVEFVYCQFAKALPPEADEIETKK